MPLTINYNGQGAGLNPMHSVGGIGRVLTGSINFASGYPLGGEDFDPSVYFPRGLLGVMFEQKDGYTFEFDEVNKTVKVLNPITGSTGPGNGSVSIYPECVIPFAGIQGEITAAQTAYIGPHDNAENTSEDIAFVVPADGSIKSMSAALGTAPGADKTLTLTLRKNGADTSMGVEISGTDVAGSNLISAVSVEAGDLITVSAFETAAGSAADLSLSIVYQSSSSTTAAMGDHTHLMSSEVAAGSNLQGVTDVKFIAWGY